MKVIITLLGVLALGNAAQSQTPSEAVEPLTKIVADNEEHVIRFIVNGKEVGRMTEYGFETINSIIHGNTTDNSDAAIGIRDKEESDAP